MAASRSAAGAKVDWRTARHGRRRHQRRVAHVAARPFEHGYRAVAEVAQDARPATALPLDPGPDGAVLAPALARALLGGRAADGERGAVPHAGHTARHAVRRRRSGLDDPRAGHAAHDRAHGLLLALGARQIVHVQVEPRRRALGRPDDLARDELQLVVVDLGALDEEHVQALVAAGGEQQRPGGPPVAPGAAGLLVIGLDRGRDGLVADRPHVRLVHPHPERVGGDDDGRGAVHEAPLHVRAQLPRQPCVIGDHLHPELPAQPVGEPVRLRPRARVDDRRQGALLGQGGRRSAPPPPPCWDTARRSRPGSGGRTRSRRAPARATPAGRRCPAPPRAWPWRWRRRWPPRRASAPRPRAGSSPAGSRAPTGTRSAPRRPRTGRSALVAAVPGSRARRTAPARRTARAHGPRWRRPRPAGSPPSPAGR